MINNDLLSVLGRGVGGGLGGLEGRSGAVLSELFFAFVGIIDPFCLNQQLLFDDFYPYYIINTRKA
jgi:hypothetical protein